MAGMSGCFSFVVFAMFLCIAHGKLSEQRKTVASKFLPVVINTWGPPFTNATSEGKLFQGSKLEAKPEHVNL